MSNVYDIISQEQFNEVDDQTVFATDEGRGVHRRNRPKHNGVVSIFKKLSYFDPRTSIIDGLGSKRKAPTL